MADMPSTITINGRDYVADEAAAANTREATAPLLAEIAVKDTAIDTRDAYIGDLAARITERDATIADLRAQLARLTTGPVTAADVQREAEKWQPKWFWAERGPMSSPWDGGDPFYPDGDAPILPAMTIPDDGRVDAGWPGADGGRDGA